MKQYRWEIGAQLANEVKAKDFKAASKSLLAVFDVVRAESGRRGLREVELRMLQILNVAIGAGDFARRGGRDDEASQMASSAHVRGTSCRAGRGIRTAAASPTDRPSRCGIDF